MTTTETKKDIHASPLHYMIWRHPSYCPASTIYHYDSELRAGYAVGEFFVLGYDVPGQGSHEERRAKYLERHAEYAKDESGRKFLVGIKAESKPTEFYSGRDLQRHLEETYGATAVTLGAKFGWVDDSRDVADLLAWAK